MKTIEIEDDLYEYIASNTKNIGESASQILRRMLLAEESPAPQSEHVKKPDYQPKKTKKSETSYQGNAFNFINKEEIATQKGAVGRFLFILAALYRAHPGTFDQVLAIKGRERHYFAKDIQVLEKSGSSTKPKQITNSEFWVVTNNNTPRKKHIITEVATTLGYDANDTEKLREFI